MVAIMVATMVQKNLRNSLIGGIEAWRYKSRTLVGRRLKIRAK